MIGPTTSARDRDIRSFGIGAALGLAGHGLAFLAGFVAAGVGGPGTGQGFADLAAVAVTFLLIEAATALACLVGAGIAFARHRSHFAAGLLTGWAVGILAALVIVKS
jgi:hypothetical protein